MTRILIFGATSAIAQATARIWARRGHRLFLVGRDPAKLAALVADLDVRAGAPGRMQGRQADLDDLPAHAALIAEANAALGGIDIVLIAHGTLPDQSRCAVDPALALKEIHTNALSVVSLCTLLGQQFEQQRAGQLAVITSVAGDRGRQSNYVYGAAKGMVSLFLQGLRNRLFAAGVNVLTIKPGFVDTPMTAGIDKGGPLWATPDAVAKGIVSALDRRRDVVYLPGFWRPIMGVIKAIPESVFKRLHL
jgi:decaprenylphospho-beta-D-erythro-pentofuranosid-2-ulose 2-reductase